MDLFSIIVSDPPRPPQPTKEEQAQARAVGCLLAWLWGSWYLLLLLQTGFGVGFGAQALYHGSSCNQPIGAWCLVNGLLAIALVVVGWMTKKPLARPWLVLMAFAFIWWIVGAVWIYSPDSTCHPASILQQASFVWGWSLVCALTPALVGFLYIICPCMRCGLDQAN